MAETLSCPHGYPSPKSCLDCMEDGPVEMPKTWQPVGSPFPARYDGECVCGSAIHPGDLVQRWDRGDEVTIYTERKCHP